MSSDSDSGGDDNYNFDSECSTPRSHYKPSIVEDHDVLMEITDENQIQKIWWDLPQYLQDNPIESVLDLEDEPTDFIRYKFKKFELLEVDKKMPHDQLIKLESELRSSVDLSKTLQAVRYKVRWIKHEGSYRSCTITTNGRGQTRRTFEYNPSKNRISFRENYTQKQEYYKRISQSNFSCVTYELEFSFEKWCKDHFNTWLFDETIYESTSCENGS